MTPKVGLALAVIVLGACALPTERQEPGKAETKKQVATEITRICSLPPDQREAELERLQAAFGIVAYCGKN